MTKQDFEKLGGTARRYRHKVTGEVISRFEFEKRTGIGLIEAAKARRAAGVPKRRQKLRADVEERYQRVLKEARKTPIDSLREIVKREKMSWTTFRKVGALKGDRIQRVEGSLEVEDRTFDVFVFDLDGKMHRIRLTPREMSRIRRGKTITVNGVAYRNARTAREWVKMKSSYKTLGLNDYADDTLYQLLKAA